MQVAAGGGAGVAVCGRTQPEDKVDKEVKKMSPELQ